MSTSRRALLDSTPLNTILGAGNEAYLESLYEQFLADPSSVELRWRDYFATLAHESSRTSADVAHGPIREAIEKRAHVHDLHATILHLMGLNQFKTAYKHNGRLEVPTVVEGRVIPELIA